MSVIPRSQQRGYQGKQPEVVEEEGAMWLWLLNGCLPAVVFISVFLVFRIDINCGAGSNRVEKYISHTHTI